MDRILLLLPLEFFIPYQQQKVCIFGHHFFPVRFWWKMNRYIKTRQHSSRMHAARPVVTTRCQYLSREGVGAQVWCLRKGRGVPYHVTYHMIHMMCLPSPSHGQNDGQMPVKSLSFATSFAAGNKYKWKKLQPKSKNTKSVNIASFVKLWKNLNGWHRTRPDIRQMSSHLVSNVQIRLAG